MSNVALALSATLVLLVFQVPRATLGNPMAVVNVATMALEPVISSLIADMHAKTMSEEITVQVWMHTDDVTANGCGFYFQADGHSGKTVHDWFPQEKIHKCGDTDYSMRMTSQSAGYDHKIHLGNDQVKKIEFHADGWQDTHVKMICFGLSPHTIVAGPRAFCIDAKLLKGCKTTHDKWADIDLEFDDIMLTRSSRGVHKMTFNDIPEIVAAFETLGGNVDDPHAADLICDKIELVRGDVTSDARTCAANKISTTSSGAGMFYSWETSRKREDKDPTGCERYEGN